MACDPIVTKGRELAFLVRDDGDTVWQVVGGVKTRGATFDNPVEDITSSSTLGEYTESDWTGYSQATLNVSGNADTRTGDIDPSTGFTIVGASRLMALATTGQRCAKARLFNVATGGYIEGDWSITSYQVTGETPGLVGFDCTLQSRADVVVVGEV